MNITIAGGTGFIGQAFVQAIAGLNHQITIIGRDKNKIQRTFADQVIAIDWSGFNKDPASLLQNTDVVINLCGANIAQRRWSKRRKKYLIASRTTPTTALATAIGQCQHPIHFINSSGISIYGLQKQLLPHTTDYNETTPPSSNPAFMVRLANDCEQACNAAKNNPNAIITQLRIAPVLSLNGGIIKKLRPSYKLNFGGRVGYGDQPFAWIQLYDLIMIMQHIISQQISGPVNCVAPEHITQEEFAHALGDRLQKPSNFFIPEWLVKLAFGQMGDECLLHGQKASPEVLLQHNYQFMFFGIESALNSPH